MKTCSKCGEEKKLEEFHKSKTGKNGLSSICKKCVCAKSQIWREQNREKHREYTRQWQQNNPERKKQADARYRDEKKEVLTEYFKQYYLENKGKKIKRSVEYRRNRLKNDEKFAVLALLRRRLLRAFRSFSKNGKCKRSDEYCINYQAICEHLGPCPGDRKDYHIDHIRPLCSFDFDDLEQVKQAFAPENHQWLLKEENLKKGSKYEQYPNNFRTFW